MAQGISLRLAKAGWWQGDPGKVLRAPADEVMGAIQFENFTTDYERGVFELNRGEKA